MLAIIVSVHFVECTSVVGNLATAAAARKRFQPSTHFAACNTLFTRVDTETIFRDFLWKYSSNKARCTNSASCKTSRHTSARRASTMKRRTNAAGVREDTKTFQRISKSAAPARRRKARIPPERGLIPAERGLRRIGRKEKKTQILTLIPVHRGRDNSLRWSRGFLSRA